MVPRVRVRMDWLDASENLMADRDQLMRVAEKICGVLYW